MNPEIIGHLLNLSKTFLYYISEDGQAFAKTWQSHFK